MKLRNINYTNSGLVLLLSCLIGWIGMDMSSICAMQYTEKQHRNYISFLTEQESAAAHVLAKSLNARILLQHPDEQTKYNHLLLDEDFLDSDDDFPLLDTLIYSTQYNPLKKFDSLITRGESHMKQLGRIHGVRESLKYFHHRLNPLGCYFDEFVFHYDAHSGLLHFGSTIPHSFHHRRLIVVMNDRTLHPKRSQLKTTLPCADSLHIDYYLLSPGERWLALDTITYHNAIPMYL